MNLKAPASVINPGGSFCPGCSHGVVDRLVAEAVEALGMQERFIATVDVACGAWSMDNWNFDTVMCEKLINLISCGKKVAPVSKIKPIGMKNE